MARVRLPSVLRPLAGGATTIAIESTRLDALPAELRARQPALAERVLAGETFSEFVSVFVDGEDVRHLASDLKLGETTEVTLLPAISGG
jgi:molybdopterin converting factor small subunit